ncbi:hypothetical protein GYMLUDRAFT_253670 [Collybiopsis luxurians FD-317 M1]|uniref:Zinc finger PHD-type domain-containing protein n=1 Tax=Collybiopsis luxurians FD-317 M1 TaxID=944289 RepID=A0A0D0C4G2_9AGAR|nr:hypothetical protein GYMLUDRAFT_253670 [Collybiopsis luxurians FD-317 M1]
MAWFSAVISPGNDYNSNTACRDYFTAQMQSIWICNSHVRIDASHHLTACIQLSQHLVQKFEGDFGEYFRSKTNIGTIARGSAQTVCWRKDNARGEMYCSGKPILVEFFSKLPVLLTFEPNSTQWNFPKVLYPSTQKHGKKTGLVYDLVGRIFTNGSHFIGHYALPTSNNRVSIFTYDGMKHYGYSQLEHGGTVDKLLAGSCPPVPAGFYSHIVMYHLRGGPAAQKEYFSTQASATLQKLHVDLSTEVPTYTHSDFQQMEQSEIALWKQAHSTEYCKKNDISAHDKKSALTHATPTVPIDVVNATSNKGNGLDSDIDQMSSSPAPSDSAHILCWCGIESDGHRAGIEQIIVKCEDCERYTHLACLVE